MRWLGPRGAWAVVLVVAAAAGPVRGQPDKVTDLIAQLADGRFTVREAAGRDLVAVGEPALPALRTAAAGPDGEVRRRATSVIRSILAAGRVSKATGLELTLVEAGDFDMGSPDREPDRRPDERPHRVRLTRPFLFGTYEVTQAEYRRVMSASPSWFAAAGRGAEAVAGMETERFPVEQVTWFDGAEFCNRLSKLDGHPPYYRLADIVREGDTIKAAAVTITGGGGYRLPTEAEWEYACRAWSDRAFHFGTLNTGREANLKPPVAAGGYGSPPTWKALGRPAKVGTYKSNLYGLFDMHGNVAEWCGDWYEADYYASAPPADPPGPAAGRHRVVRGGSWMVTQGSCRSASRYWLTPGGANHSTGFRVARMP